MTELKDRSALNPQGGRGGSTCGQTPAVVRYLPDQMDSELLISAVKKMPCIWDPSSDGYQDKSRTKDAWAGVCAELSKKYKTMPENERNALAINTQKRWRNLRDCYVKDTKALLTYGNLRLAKRRKYIFSEQLSFLAPVVEAKFNTTTDDSEERTTPEETSQPLEEKYRPPEDPNSMEYVQEDTDPLVDEKLYPICNVREGATSSSSRYPGDEVIKVDPLLADEDLAFFFSILPMVKMFDVDTKLEFRMDVIKLLRTYIAKCKRPVQ